MKKLIMGTSMTCYRGAEENLDEYIEIFKEYFDNIAHHYLSKHYLDKNVILIYSHFPSRVQCRGCTHHRSDIFILNETNKNVPEVFYDMRAGDIPCSRIDKINYSGRHIGYYCPTHNILCVGDIAHESGQENHVRNLIEGLERRGIFKRKDEIRKKQTVMLGADPEMETAVNGSMVSAFELPQMCTREKAYISHDGMTQPQRELRPDPANTPEELVENIRDLIKISSFFGEELTVVGKIAPLGGHIHIGNASPSKELTLVLDYFLSPLNEFNSELRVKSKYGKLGDVRAKPHGFEYRTPPAIWLLTPTLAKMVLEITKDVVEKIINGIDVEISDNLNIDEYKDNVEQLGFTREWVTQFIGEIAWAKSNINEPLAKTWGVDIPQEFKIKKLYRSKPRQGHPFEERPSPQLVLDSEFDDEEEDE